MFFKYNSLESLPDITKWDNKNIKYMIGIFSGCSSLHSITDISKWNIKKVMNMNDINGGI